MKTITVEFYGIDSWNRPIFKDVNDKRFFGSTWNLYGYGEEEQAIEFYSNDENLQSLVYFGRSFDCEPLGIGLKELNIKLERSK